MKKLLNVLLTVFFACFASSAFADVGCYNNGSHNASTGTFNATSHCGPTADINYLSPTGSSQQNQVGMVRDVPVVDQNLFAAGVAQGGYVSVPSTSAALPIGYAYVRKVITSNGDALYTAGTLANGYPGQILTIYVAGLSPSGATTGGNYTITPTTSTGWASLELTAVNDVATFMYVDSITGWVIINHSGTITIVLKN